METYSILTNNPYIRVEVERLICVVKGKIPHSGNM